MWAGWLQAEGVVWLHEVNSGVTRSGRGWRARAGVMTNKQAASKGRHVDADLERGRGWRAHHCATNERGRSYWHPLFEGAARKSRRLERRVKRRERDRTNSESLWREKERGWKVCVEQQKHRKRWQQSALRREMRELESVEGWVWWCGERGGGT